MTKLFLTTGERGQAVLVAVLFFVLGSTLVISAVAGPMLRQAHIINNWLLSRQSFYAGESGVEDVTYRIKNSLSYDTSESESVGGVLSTVTVASNSGRLVVTGSGNQNSLVRKTEVIVQSGVSAPVSYGIQTDGGGFWFQNSASVVGNIFSNGPIELSASPNGTSFVGNITSAGASGTIEGVLLTGNAYAHSIEDSTISGDAYYQTISGSSVGGTAHAGSTDVPTASLPLTDSTITQLETNAASGGTVSSPCPYTISTSRTLGPIKINCDLQISGGTVTLLGNVWVKGSITFSGLTTSVVVDSALTGQSIAMIADNPSDNSTSGTIRAQNSVTFGAPSNSFISLISMNTSASTGGTTNAVRVMNSVQGVGGVPAPLFLYAPYGKVQIMNSAKVTSAAGYSVYSQNSAIVEYQSALANMVFPSSSDFSIRNWRETQ